VKAANPNTVKTGLPQTSRADAGNLIQGRVWDRKGGKAAFQATADTPSPEIAQGQEA